jgi:threonine synthase
VTSFELACARCGSPAEPIRWSCESCGGPLNVVGKRPFDRRLIGTARSIWRYSELLAYVGEVVVSLGEGLTPVTRLGDSLYLKLDYLNPTGSFKDRGSSLAVTTHLAVSGARGWVNEDSSGNAGASMAAYCARAGIPIRVYVPSGTSGRKLEQIRSYGAEVVVVEGPRDHAARLAQGAEGVYLGHVWNPFFIEGMKTLAYEIAEQFEWDVPDRVYFPCSVGTILLGLLYGFREMLEAGAIRQMPKLVAVQPRNVSPLYHRLRGLPYRVPEGARSIADAIASHGPPRLEQMVDEMRRVGGECVVLEEEEIVRYTRELARAGFHVEPSAALGYGGYVKQREEGLVSGSSIAILTGIGLKAPPV